MNRNVAGTAKPGAGPGHDGSQGMEITNMQSSAAVDTGAGRGAPGGWPLVAELFCADAERDWDWEGIRIGNKLHLYCYLRDAVVALAPFELDP